ncbi:MAG: hypothetical protein PWP28_437 [Oceanotoga sp.]|nr:hypothetical protein [Oceanotoga sp.]MDN5341562.1 hypothetical protein [Oceanotoga sp.]
MIYNKNNLGDNVNKICENEDCTVFEMHNDTGDGKMILYDVFPGISLMYNDFYMEKTESKFETPENIFCIDHCREGRIQWNIKDDLFMYLKQGDLRIDDRDNHKKTFEFPIKHYHGITICFYLDKAEYSIKKALDGFPINIGSLKNKFLNKTDYFVLRSEKSIEHIFSELYSVPNDIKKQYFQIKILELLLYLSVIDISKNNEKPPYFYRSQ